MSLEDLDSLNDLLEEFAECTEDPCVASTKAEVERQIEDHIRRHIL